MPVTLSNTSITFNDATVQTTAASNAYQGLKSQVFTASGTFTVPTGVTSLIVRVWGAGGGGAGGSPSGGPLYDGNTGGSGGFVEAAIAGLTPGASIAVTVGTGGNGAAAGANAGAGGTSSFGAYASATGGAAGTSGNPPVSQGIGTVSGATRITNRNTIGRDYGGHSGWPGDYLCTSEGGGGGGGGLSSGGGGGGAYNYLVGGQAGANYGPGNSGVAGASGGGGVGGAGGAGGSPGGAGGAGGSAAAGGGGGGGGGVMVFW